MGQQKIHKKCVQDIHNKLKHTHQCYKEYPVFREGNVHFIDTVGFPHKDKINFKPVAVECESRSSKPQQESNRHDLAEFKKRYPDAEIFQVNNAEEVDFKRLNRMEQRPFFRPPIRRF